MAADLDVSDDPPPRALLLILAIAAWLGVVVLVGLLVVDRNYRHAQEAFRLQASSLYWDMAGRLSAHEAMLESVAVFLRVSEGAEEGLELYVQQLLHRFPVFQVLVQHRVEAGEIADAALREDEDRFRFPSWRPLPPAATVYYPVTFVAPPRAQSQVVPGLDVQSLAYLRAGLEEALAQGRPAASRPFALADGEMAFALFHPVFEQQDPAYGATLASVVIRARDLLPEEPPWVEGSLLLALRSPEGRPPVLKGIEQPPVSATERRLFPPLRFSGRLDDAQSPLVFELERQLKWGQVAPAGWLPGAAAALLGLFLILSYVKVRLRQEAGLRTTARRLYRLANYDTLTGLPNRNLLGDRLQQALARARRAHTAVAVLFLDLDGFKAVNDTAGHDAGDRLLIAVAQRLSACVRDQDTVSRLSGDEFVIVLEGVAGREDAERVVLQVQECLSERISVGEFDFLVTASVGLALYPEDANDGEGLLRRADHVMYSRKHPDWVAALR
jgi:diguanylate cyclase